MGSDIHVDPYIHWHWHHNLESKLSFIGKPLSHSITKSMAQAWGPLYLIYWRHNLKTKLSFIGHQLYHTFKRGDEGASAEKLSELTIYMMHVWTFQNRTSTPLIWAKENAIGNRPTADLQLPNTKWYFPWTFKIRCWMPLIFTWGSLYDSARGSPPISEDRMWSDPSIKYRKYFEATTRALFVWTSKGLTDRNVRRHFRRPRPSFDDAAQQPPAYV
jgi:hypothetical protein